MNIDRCDQIAKEKMSKSKAHLERETGYIYNHGRRTGRLALQLARNFLPANHIDSQTVHVACLFHDLGKSLEPHAKTGALLAKEYLKEECNPVELERISFLISQHPYRKTGKYPGDTELQLIQDADILDHFGTQEIWLQFLHSSNTSQSPRDAVGHWQGEWFRNHVKSCRALLNFEFSIAEYDTRVSFTEQFITRFAQESEGMLAVGS